MRNFILTTTLLLGLSIKAQTLPQVSEGKVQRIENFKSIFVEARNIDVWLPKNYNPAQKYNVVYMHDGQMIYDANTTWNKQEWKVDETLSQLMKDEKIENCIVVGVWNSSDYRISEYFPDKIFNQLDEKQQTALADKYSKGKKAFGDAYLKFLVTELKPYIDKNFSTYADKDHTFVMGSSMGGLISVYAISEYPETFGGAACLSTAWLSQIEPNYAIPTAVFEYLKKSLASPLGHKIYMDYGTGESDKPYELTQSFVDLIAKGKGYSDANFLSKVYDKAEHNEVAWSSRLNVPFEFLMAKKQNQKPVAGKIDLYPDFKSNYVTARNVEVWLPENYNPKKKYAVLYMHDGQMLYDASTTWNKQAWDVDDIATKLMQEGKVQDFIVVGVWNGGKTRHADYFPQKPFESLPKAQQDSLYGVNRTNGASVFNGYKVQSDKYLQFLVKELKPFIDKKYAVYKDKNHTFVMGSSMGGLISMYAITQYPDVFGGAACLSTHWPGVFSMENNPVPQAFYNYLKTNVSKIKTGHKIYFDYGDQTLDALYPPLQAEVDGIMKTQGFTEKNWKTQFFTGKDHSENAWKERLNIPLEFLLGK